MALTDFQNGILRLLADNRRKNVGSYVAGGLALNHALSMPRTSRDIDIFHDSEEALYKSWLMDRKTLEGAGYCVGTKRELRTFIAADISKDGEHPEIQWGVDSAYRFFPLDADATVGYTLHPIDLAASKLTTLVGHADPRDWIDVIVAMRNVQPMLYLLSAACGKDPGFSPTSMLEYVARRRYTQVEIDAKITPAGKCDAAELNTFWREEIERTRSSVMSFPRDKAGMCVLGVDGKPYTGDPSALADAMARGEVVFHEGRICGAWQRIVES